MHRKDCKNLNSLDLTNRKIEVKWKDKVVTDFTANLKILSNYRENVTIEIMKKLQELKVNLKSIKAENRESQEMIIYISIVTSNNDALNRIIRELKRIDSVYEVKRAR